MYSSVRLITHQVVHGLEPTEAFSGHTKSTQKAFIEFMETTIFQVLSVLYDEVYFTRLWVIQEVALSRSASLIYGSHEMSYKNFAFGTAVLHSLMQTVSTTP